MSKDKNKVTVGVQLSLEEIELILSTLGVLTLKNKDHEKLIENLAASKGVLQRATR